MDFELTINDKKTVVSKYHTMEEEITAALRYWNNFESATPITFSVRKVPNNTPTLGINIHDQANTQDLFGRR